ncbi:immune-associated nucleotide-binding protein 11-like [Lingula anatina]|uniref:Immune-associated nucleotide-binding protein 11-like n=1 Tax=Lingula anatina TaxID=7574 RepID=A0A1S3K8G7_LINAN|nr:immune-associated nucleotide-binding protein 11-like [Lingula anatina]|eukprot:XP_013418792.1 immune-associated nucleotide-binding protein 11-like [Lingula anatina]
MSAKYGSQAVCSPGRATTKTYNVLVVGYKGQGKSATVMKLSGDLTYEGKNDKNAHKSFILKEPSSCTVQVVDTPGLGSLSTSDRKILGRISKEARCLQHVDAILIVFKMGRIKSTQLKAVAQFRNIFGDNFLQKSIIVLTFADDIKQKNTTINEFIANSPETFQSIHKDCSERIWCVENSDWEDREEKQGELMELIKSVETVPYEVPDAERIFIDTDMKKWAKLQGKLFTM